MPEHAARALPDLPAGGLNAASPPKVVNRLLSPLLGSEAARALLGVGALTPVRTADFELDQPALVDALVRAQNRSGLSTVDLAHDWFVAEAHKLSEALTAADVNKSAAIDWHRLHPRRRLIIVRQERCETLSASAAP
jgi:hypothetical protein